MDFKISVVMAVYNSEAYVAEAIDSVINQSLNFKKHIQLILVDDKSTDDTLDIIEGYQKEYPDNIVLVTNEKNMGPAFSRNRGLEHVRGKYVNFLDSNDFISKDAFKRACKFLDKYYEVDIVSIPLHFFGVKRGPHNLNFKFEKDQLVNLITDPQYIQLSGASSFFRFDRLKKYHFNENLRVSEDPLLINQMLLENPLMGFLSKPKYFYRKDEFQNSLITTSASNKSYFTTRIDEYFLNLISYALERFNEVPKFIQYVLMYDLQWILEIDFVEHLLSKDELRSLYNKILEILSHIDDDVILDQISIPAALKAHIILMKRYGWDYLNDKTKVKDDFNLNTLFIDNLRFLNESEVEIDGILTNFTKGTDIIAVVDGKEIKTEKRAYPQRDNYSLNFSYGFNHCFKVRFPITDGSRITFKSSDFDLKIEYSQTSRLNEVSGYLNSRDNLAVADGNEIKIIKKSVSSLAKLETKTLLRMLKTRSEGWRTGTLIRLFYLISHPVLTRRRIWIHMDLPYGAGDNGLELFRYANSQNSKIRHYFVLDKSPLMEEEYLVLPAKEKLKRLTSLTKADENYLKIKEIGKVISYRSIKHRMYTLFAEFIITSHPDNTVIYPFWGNYKHLSGLARSKTVFLQHGVTKDNVSEWLNDYDKPLAMISCVSEREKESFKNPDYGYDSEIAKVLGFPRFDRLENNKRKEIVLMPSWRRQLDQLSAAEFVKSDFYNNLNGLLSNTEFIDWAVSEGYTLIFKPHRNLHKFIDTFTRHPSVRFDLNLSNYSETFNNASILITDYSSVAFDFAYMKKPVIYYQFGQNYHFDVENAYFSYEEDGFGPVCKNKDELRDYILKIIDNNLEMEETYRKRVDDFFKYHDRDNSRRVYEEILKLDNYY